MMGKRERLREYGKEKTENEMERLSEKNPEVFKKRKNKNKNLEQKERKRNTDTEEE